jgi:superfamily II DNA/RNA helicase
LQRVGLRAEAIHGDRSQQERLATLNAFKANLVDVLVATDVAARGLDIAELPCVINYDVPYHAEDYVHRIGRTGRAGASGAAYTLYTPDEARSLADVEKFIKRTIERESLQAVPDTDYQERERLRELRKRRHEAMEHGESRERSHPERAASRPTYKQSADPFFSQLYVPSSPAMGGVAQVTAPADSVVVAPKPVAKPKAGMAALFGAKR